MSVGGSLDLERTLLALNSHVEADRESLVRRIVCSNKTSQLTEQLVAIERTVLLTHISQLCQERAALKALLRAGGTDIAMDMAATDGGHHVVESLVVSELRSALKSTRERLLAAESRQRDIAKDMSALTTENVRLQTANAELTATVHRQSADIAEANRQLNYANNDAAKYKQQTAAAIRETAIAHSREKATLQADLAQMQRRFKEAENKIISLQRELQEKTSQPPLLDDLPHIAIIDETSNVNDMSYRTQPNASPPSEYSSIVIAGRDATISEESEHNNDSDENSAVQYSVNVSSPRRRMSASSQSRSPANTTSPRSLSTHNNAATSPISTASNSTSLFARSATPTHDGAVADAIVSVSQVNEIGNAVEAADPATTRAFTTLLSASATSHDDNTVVTVDNLSSETDVDALRDVFAHCGEVKSIRLSSADANGAALIEFVSAESAAKALDMNGHEFNGRSIKVTLSRPSNLPRSVQSEPPRQRRLQLKFDSADADEIKQITRNST